MAIFQGNLKVHAEAGIFPRALKKSVARNQKITRASVEANVEANVEAKVAKPGGRNFHVDKNNRVRKLEQASPRECSHTAACKG